MRFVSNVGASQGRQLAIYACVYLTLICFVFCQRDHSGEAPAAVEVYGWWDLPKEDPRSHELSGIAWDPDKKVLFAIPDKTPQIVELVPDPTFHRWRFGERIPVQIPGGWDGEGLALTEEGFLISSEVGPCVYEVRRNGAWVATLPLPEHFQRSRGNLALESLGLTMDRRYLFTANEQALLGDGPLTTHQTGTLVRILRHDRVIGAQAEFAYRTDPILLGDRDGELGVVDLAALTPRDLLVMERGFVPGAGNTVRIYRVHTDGATDTLAVKYLDDGKGISVLKKELFLDLGTLPDGLFPPSTGPQPSRILANFEGLALGPPLARGKRLLFLISDNNSSAAQLSRLLMLVIGS